MTDTAPQSETARRFDPANVLFDFIVALLAPMFLGVAGGNIEYARLAAAETVNGYTARSHSDLIAVAQIIAFGLAALGSLSLSMADDITVNMALRLRGNAIVCNRAAEQNRRALANSLAADPVPHDSAATPEPEPEPDTILSEQMEQQLFTQAQDQLQATRPANVSEKRYNEMWAIAMVKEAGEIAASIPDLPPEERGAASMRAANLGSTAHNLLYGTPSAPPPA